MPREQMELGPNGWLFLLEWEQGPDGGMALEAYLCPAGVPTILFGVTEYPDGRPVRMGDRLTAEEGMEIQRAVLKVYETGVWNALPENIREQIGQNQFDAVTLSAYNLGIPQVTKRAEFFRLVCEGRFAQAESEFGNYHAYRTSGPTKAQMGNPAYADIIGRDGKGRICWIGPDGRPCRYRQMSRGILRGHLSRACLFAGYSWREACTTESVFCVPAPPGERFWNAGDGCWQDRLKTKTRWADIRPVAEKYPLDQIEWDPANDPPYDYDADDYQLPEVTEEDFPVTDLPEFEIEEPEPEPKPRPQKAPAPATPPPATSPIVGTKDLTLSKRFWGLLITALSSLNFIPAAWRSVFGDPAARELLIWGLALLGGVLWYRYGKKVANRYLT